MAPNADTWQPAVADGLIYPRRPHRQQLGRIACSQQRLRQRRPSRVHRQAQLPRLGHAPTSHERPHTPRPFDHRSVAAPPATTQHTLALKCTRVRVTPGRGGPRFKRLRGMGRRQRRRNQADAPARVPPSRIARVRVDESTWATFKAAIGDQSVAEVLGRYVEAEAARAQRERMDEDDITERQLVDALEKARVLTGSLERITSRLEARLQLHTSGP